MPEIPEIFQAAAYDYELPERAIAQEPPPRREDARLLTLLGPAGTPPRDLRIPDLPSLLAPGDLLVLNDTRVIPARLFGTRERTGGRAELLLLGERDGAEEALMKTRGTPDPGELFSFGGGRIRAELLERGERGHGRFRLEPAGAELRATLESVGRLPLPPYVRRNRDGDPRDALDRERYQTVFAAREGAVAAPTAGLHLSPELLDRIAARGVERTTVTLHVGPGTFRPVQDEDLRAHPMHTEAYEVTPAAAAAVAACRARGGRIIPVGTTAVRVLESATDPSGALIPGPGETCLFIHPPWPFRSVDALVTNFHAPRSTLLMLVAALAGRERVLAAYRHAVAQGYRFLSYGDAMFIG